MSRVRSRGNETTEGKLRSMLQEVGLVGWKCHADLPGKPDFVWPKHKVTVFVDGCFWHGHECGKNIKPKANAELWQAKIENNKRRDRRVVRQLRGMGWGVIRIWECELTKNPEGCITRIKRLLARKKRQLSTMTRD
ncbi:MAG: very short patch repair endonuclease [Proteobacteria bacterium]|nr:very short patch repair endonuclease [Pseudomonadota bacterium]MBU1740795.1 very short patch repair endonuclease [Pseudomonadota bacterium]